MPALAAARDRGEGMLVWKRHVMSVTGLIGSCICIAGTQTMTTVQGDWEKTPNKAKK